MKKLIVPALFAFMLCTAFIVPKPNSLSDYRDAYTGNYTCQVSGYYLRPMEGPAVVEETISLSVIKATIDSVVQITIGNGASLFKLKNDTLFSYPEGNIHRGGRFYDSDSIAVYFMNRGSGSSIAGKKD